MKFYVAATFKIFAARPTPTSIDICSYIYIYVCDDVYICVLLYLRIHWCSSWVETQKWSG